MNSLRESDARGRSRSAHGGQASDGERRKNGGDRQLHIVHEISKNLRWTSTSTRRQLTVSGGECSWQSIPATKRCRASLSGGARGRTWPVADPRPHDAEDARMGTGPVTRTAVTWTNR